MALSLLLSRYLFDTHLAKDSYRDGRNTPKMQLWKSETSRDIKKFFWYHLNIFKSYVNFQN